MTSKSQTTKPYDHLLSGARLRPSKVRGRTLEEEADADRGRVLFCAPFRRLQNKAQVFSLETNAAIRSRLTHSLEVSSIGRYVAERAIANFDSKGLETLGIVRKKRALLTFVETACLLHDIGNPPFGHFGEIAISDWFHLHSDSLKPEGIGGSTSQTWARHVADFQQFDGNPQGFRICTKLQPRATQDLFGLNLSVTTLAATLKYPWTSERIGQSFPDRKEIRKKCGYFLTEKSVADSVSAALQIEQNARHPLVYLVEAADDIAYCVSDIEDGIEKRLVSAPAFADYMLEKLKGSAILADNDDPEHDGPAMLLALKSLREPVDKIDGLTVQHLTPMQDFRSSIIRYLAHKAGAIFCQSQPTILEGTAPSLLRSGEAALLLESLKDFAVSSLYSSPIVRNRELTAQAVLTGLLDAYKPLMTCSKTRFDKALAGAVRDDDGRPIARDSSLAGRIARKFVAVYREAVRRSDEEFNSDAGMQKVMERVHRIRLMIDHVSGMTDEFALQSFQLISGVQINPHRTT